MPSRRPGVGSRGAGAVGFRKRAPGRRQLRPRRRLLRAAMRRRALSARAPRQRNAGRACRAMCPASQTKIFYGSEIGGAVAKDGARYADLDTAFTYRQHLVANCTCNGRNARGLAPFDLSSDPTLRPGDIVSTKDGFVAYTGKPGQADAFTPVDPATIATELNSDTSHVAAVSRGPERRLLTPMPGRDRSRAAGISAPPCAARSPDKGQQTSFGTQQSESSRMSENLRNVHRCGRLTVCWAAELRRTTQCDFHFLPRARRCCCARRRQSRKPTHLIHPRLHRPPIRPTPAQIPRRRFATTSAICFRSPVSPTSGCCPVPS